MEYAGPPPPDSLTLPSGRVLSWTVYGGALRAAGAAPPRAPAVIFYFHGFPGAGCEAAFLQPALLAQLDARCIGLDRPGMGRSSHDPHRRMLDWPADVLAVADHLAVDDFYILAVSGGGPYGLACAKEIGHVRHPDVPVSASPPADAETDARHTGAQAASTASAASNVPPRPALKARLRGVAVVSGIYPTTLGLDGMLAGPRTLLTAGAWLPRMATGALLDWQVGRAARNSADPTALKNMLDAEMAKRPEFERSAYNSERVRRTVVDGARESFRQGGRGVATDLMLYSAWGFKLSDVDADGVRLWHGKLDQNVPFAMAEKAAKFLPRAETHFIEDEGHLGLPVRHCEEILTDLLRDRLS